MAHVTLKGCLLIGIILFMGSVYSQCVPGSRPNFIIYIADDQSWIHTSISGDPVVKTPHFDRIAREGVLFRQAFCAASSCTPSRSAILTGKNIYELENASILNSFLPSHFLTYQDLLEDAGYLVGCIGKGTKPGLQSLGGRTRDPAGWEYNGITISGAPTGINPVDFAANLEEGLEARQEGQPFSFWIGAYEPHRPYGNGLGRQSGIDTSKLNIPAFLPNVSAFAREEIADYLFEVQWFDKQLGEIIKTLEKHGELDNTVILVTADNGMPFPRAKAELYEYGVHVPLAIRWAKSVSGGKKVDDYVNLRDIAPTFLEAAGLPVPREMTAKSFLNVLTAAKDGRVDAERDHVFVAHERHGVDGKRPRRGIYTDDFAYIYNYPCCLKREFSDDSLWAVTLFEANKDILPYSSLLWKFRTHPLIRQYWEWYRGERKEHELYDRKNDPDQLHNLAYEPGYAAIVDSLYKRVMDYGRNTHDPRAADPETTVFDTYEEFGYEWQAQNPGAVDNDRLVMLNTGVGRRKGTPVKPPQNGVTEVKLNDWALPGPFILNAKLNWNFARPGREITKYKVYFFDEDQNKTSPLVQEVCAHTSTVELKSVVIPETAVYIGVISANDAGEFYTSQSLTSLPVLSPDKIYPIPVKDIFTLKFYWTPGQDFFGEVLDIQGRNMSKIKTEYTCQGGECTLAGDLSDYPSGLYFLRIYSNGKFQTYRLMKTSD
ncbi:MAG: sulfatase-like hydrolase/transferase [Bacteroidia bacterium]|nr:sulfatase-like hydrolase/transferase [Bacteroidia bacterium]